MKILVLGAGAVGGYFGGRLVEKGEDVTFLLREKRKQQLDQHGLSILSPHGDFNSKVQTLKTGDKAEPFDLVIVGVKNYHLHDAILSVSSYIGENTTILPLLNGYSHIEKLEKAFRSEKVIGGVCQIESTLNENGEIIQTSSFHNLLYGERDGSYSERIDKIHEAFSGANYTSKVSDMINTELWKKYIFITAFSGITTLMNSSIGPILETEEGKKVYNQLVNELVCIAEKEEAPLHDHLLKTTIQFTDNLQYEMKSSMQRDMEKGLPIEADYLQGWFIEKAKSYQIEPHILKVVYAKLKTYEVNRGSEKNMKFEMAVRKS